MSLGGFLSERPLFSLLLILNLSWGGILTLYNIMVLKKNNLSGGYIFMLLICPIGGSMA